MLDQLIKLLANNPQIVGFVLMAIVVGCVYLLGHEVRRQQFKAKSTRQTLVYRGGQTKPQSTRSRKRSDLFDPPSIAAINRTLKPKPADPLASPPAPISSSQEERTSSIPPLEELPPDIPIAASIPDYAPIELPRRLVPLPLRNKLVRRIGEDATDRLIDRYQQKFPDRPDKWLYEKALYDLERDRQ